MWLIHNYLWLKRPHHRVMNPSHEYNCRPLRIGCVHFVLDVWLVFDCYKLEFCFMSQMLSSCYPSIRFMLCSILTPHIVFYLACADILFWRCLRPATLDAQLFSWSVQRLVELRFSISFYVAPSSTSPGLTLIAMCTLSDSCCLPWIDSSLHW